MKKLILSILLVLCMASTCINRSAINDIITPSAFIILDAYVATQIDVAAENCFDIVDGDGVLSGEDALNAWYTCMFYYKTMETAIDNIKNNMEEGDGENLKINLKFLINIMKSLSLTIPEEIENIKI